MQPTPAASVTLPGPATASPDSRLTPAAPGAPAVARAPPTESADVSGRRDRRPLPSAVADAAADSSSIRRRVAVSPHADAVLTRHAGARTRSPSRSPIRRSSMRRSIRTRASSPSIGKAVGTTTITLTDGRGRHARSYRHASRSKPDRSAPETSGAHHGPSRDARVHPRSRTRRRERAALSARSGANVLASTDGIVVRAPLKPDDITDVDVPIVIQGGEQYFSVQGTTTVHVENYAQPLVRPQPVCS